jgi:F0F1-type ATP synthase delta subunit
MISKVRERLMFAQIMLSHPLEMICEVIVTKESARLLTNPLDSIINYVAEIDNLKKIAVFLSIEPTENNLEELFEAICSRYDEMVKNSEFVFLTA